MNSFNTKINILRLYRSNNVGSKTFLKLYKKFHNINKMIEFLSNHSEINSFASALNEYEKLKNYGGNFITYFDDLYPSILKQLPDPPIILSYKGNINLLHRPIIAIIGGRDASLNGANIASNIANYLSNKGYVIISGLAKGIDRAAHQGATSKNTIAVIANGIDQIYPESNRDIFQDIAQNGLIITEQTFSSSPQAKLFPKRNRIIAGLTKHIIVIEAKQKSGSLITCRLGLESGCEIISVPGHPYDNRVSGCNNLIKDGANIFTSLNDLNEILKINHPIAPIKTANDNINYDSLQNKILSLLSDVAVNIDEIQTKLNYSQDEVLSCISMLEMDEKIIRDNNNMLIKNLA